MERKFHSDAELTQDRSEMLNAVFNRSFDYCADIIAFSKNFFIGIFSFNLTSMEELRYLQGDQKGFSQGV